MTVPHKIIDTDKKEQTIEQAAEEYAKRFQGYDMVNNPAHYDLFPGTQAIEIIRKALTPEEYIGYLKGNVLKYRLRAGKKKDAMQDIKKADWYETELWTFKQGRK